MINQKENLTEQEGNFDQPNVKSSAVKNRKYKIQQIKKLFKCEKCNMDATVEMIHTFDGEENEVRIKKCTRCRYQYYLKQLFDIATRHTPVKVK